jgi:MFS family permease
MLPVTMMVPVLKEIVADRFGGSSFWSHAFMSVNMIGAVVAAPFGGVLADRLGRCKPIVVAALIADAALIWLLMLASSIPALLFFRFLEGAAHILAVSTLMALASDWADARRRGRMMGTIGATLIFGTACGAPLGGRIGGIAPMAVLHLGAVIALTAAVVAWLGVRDADTRHRLASWRAARAVLHERRALLVPYAYTFIDRFCVGVIISSFVLFLAGVHGLTPPQRGGLLAVFLFPFALLCYPAGRLSDRWGRVWMMSIGSLGFGAVFAAYGFLSTSSLWWAMLASGVLSAVMFAPNLALCSDLSPRDQRATAFAGFNMAGSLGFLAGPLIGGVTLHLASKVFDPGSAYRATFIVAGATEALCALITLPWLLSLGKRLPPEA